jgi:hypothetical protein
MALDDLKNRIAALRAFDVKEEVRQIVDNSKDVLVEKQREQLLAGRGRDGEWIRPFYSENPYFATKQQAFAYAEWKATIEPNHGRPFDVPNLYIFGRFHASLFAVVTKDDYTIASDDPNAADIIGVHKNAIGLNDNSRAYYARVRLMPVFRVIFKQKTGMRISITR